MDSASNRPFSPCPQPDQMQVQNGMTVPDSQRAFTWKDARNVAIIVRDGLLMIVKGLEKVFELGGKG